MRFSKQTRQPRSIPVRAMQQPVTVYVKGDPKANRLLDCPFSHRVLLALEEKHIPWEPYYVDEYNKQEDFLKLYPEGKIPVLKEGDKVLPDSDRILPHLEDEVPEPSLKNNDPDLDRLMAENQVFAAFREFLMEDNPKQAEEEEAVMRAELDRLEAYLADHGGPFFGGDHPVQADITFAPRLYHLQTALRRIKGYELPPQYQRLRAFMNAMRARDSWRRVDYGEEVIEEGWRKKMATMKGQ